MLLWASTNCETQFTTVSFHKLRDAVCYCDFSKLRDVVCYNVIDGKFASGCQLS